MIKNKKNIIISSVIVLIFIISIPLFVLNNKVKGWDNLVYPGVKINNVELSGKTVEEAKTILEEEIINKLGDKKIIIKAGDKTYILNYKDLNLKFNEDEMILKALSYGKDTSVIKKYNIINNKEDKNLDLIFAYDETKIKEIGDKIKKEISKEPKDAVITYIGNDKFSVTDSVTGYEIDENILISDIKSKISGNTSNDEEIVAKVVEKKPTKTSEELKKINSLISTFSTDFSTSDWGRTTNLKVAAASINGTILMPGESFSFNKAIGKTTPEKGYQLAPVIVNNEIEQDYGGGVCQIATTLYNSLIIADLKIDERHNHSLPSHYVGLGMDATVSNPYLDLKFTNSYSSPIFIRGYALNSNIYFSVYSDSSEKKYDYTFYSKNSQIPTSSTIKYDANLEEGKEVVTKKANIGYKVEVYRNTIQNGKTIKTELLYKDTYNPVKGLVTKGTKKVEAIVTPPAPPVTPPAPPVTPPAPPVTPAPPTEPPVTPPEPPVTE